MQMKDKEGRDNTDTAHTVHRVPQPYDPVPDLLAIPRLLGIAECRGSSDEHETDRDAASECLIFAAMPWRVVGEVGLHIMDIDRTREPG